MDCVIETPHTQISHSSLTHLLHFFSNEILCGVCICEIPKILYVINYEWNRKTKDMKRRICMHTASYELCWIYDYTCIDMTPTSTSQQIPNKYP